MSYNGYKVIDAHCHIYPDKIVDKAVPATDRFYDVKSACRGTVSDLIQTSEFFNWVNSIQRLT